MTTWRLQGTERWQGDAYSSYSSDARNLNHLAALLLNYVGSQIFFSGPFWSSMDTSRSNGHPLHRLCQHHNSCYIIEEIRQCGLHYWRCCSHWTIHDSWWAINWSFFMTSYSISPAPKMCALLMSLSSLSFIAYDYVMCKVSITLGPWEQEGRWWLQEDSTTTDWVWWSIITVLDMSVHMEEITSSLMPLSKVVSCTQCIMLLLDFLSHSAFLHFVPV